MHALALKLLSGGKVRKWSADRCAIFFNSASRVCRERSPMLKLRIGATAAALVQLMTGWVHAGMPHRPSRWPSGTALMQRILTGCRCL